MLLLKLRKRITPRVVEVEKTILKNSEKKIIEKPVEKAVEKPKKLKVSEEKISKEKEKKVSKEKDSKEISIDELFLKSKKSKKSKVSIRPKAIEDDVESVSTTYDSDI